MARHGGGMVSGLLFLDCDSTLSAVEGVDELARLRGPDCLERVARLTDEAMAGDMPIHEVFGKRLDLIRPSRGECEKIGNLYLKTIAPGVAAALDQARRVGWLPVILSGGFLPCVAPLARHLGIADVAAVPLCFDESGGYAGFDGDYPTTRNGGKPEIIAAWRATRPTARVVMVGDGVSDLETAPVVDSFIGFGGFVRRAKVVESSPRYIDSFSQLPAILGSLR